MLVSSECRRDRALHNFGCRTASTVLPLYRACVTAGHSKRDPRDSCDRLLQAWKTRDEGKLLKERKKSDSQAIGFRASDRWTDCLNQL